MSEVDEISNDDLMAASDMYDRVVKRSKGNRMIAFETRSIKDKWYLIVEVDGKWEVIDQTDNEESAIKWRDRNE